MLLLLHNECLHHLLLPLAYSFCVQYIATIAHCVQFFIFLKPSVLNCDWRTWGITNLTCSFCVWDSFVFTSICSACQIQLVHVMLICVNSSSFSVKILGGSSRVVNSLDFYPASLKSHGCFHFQCILSSPLEGGDNKFAWFTVPTLKAFLKAWSQHVWPQGRTCFSCCRMPPKAFFSKHSRSSDQPSNDAKTLFPPSSITFPL